MAPGGGGLSVALLDADLIAYRVAAAAETDASFEPSDTSSRTFSESDVRRALASTIDEWVSKAGASDRKVFLTGSGNFRKSVCPTYKANRKDAVRPLALSFARSVLKEDHGAVWVDGLEADDLIGLSLTGKYREKGIAVSLDKDLKTVPGLHLNPLKDDFPVLVEDLEADRTWMRQVLTGDSTDGYVGAKGIGPVKADKALRGKNCLTSMWFAVQAAYRSVGASEQDALTTARLARILRKGDYEKSSRTILLWHPTTPERLPLGH